MLRLMENLIDFSVVFGAMCAATAMLVRVVATIASTVI